MAVLNAGAAEGDASQRIPQPSGDCGLSTGDSGEQVSPVLKSGAALQHSDWGGPLSQLAPEQFMWMGAAWQQEQKRQQQQQQQGNLGPQRKGSIAAQIFHASAPQHPQMSVEQVQQVGMEQEQRAQVDM